MQNSYTFSCHTFRKLRMATLSPGTIRGDRLKARRQELNFTQEQLVELAKMDQKTISFLENGKEITITTRTLVNLAIALKTSTDWLLGLTNSIGDSEEFEEIIARLRQCDPDLRPEILAAIKAVIDLAMRIA
jgi:transcriptional regulator with XRE-family HTH domain